MGVSERDLAVYLHTARLRAQRPAASSVSRREEAWAAARRAAAFIRERCPNARVRVFGSLLHPDSFGARSDIDLAVDGVEWPEYFHVWSVLEAREPGFRIDLVDVSIVSDGMRRHIEREGVPLPDGRRHDR